MNDANAIYNFVSRKIAELDEDSSAGRAACAKLRRAIGKHPGASPEIWGVTLQGAPAEWDSRDGKPSCEEWAVHTALTLYALHRQGKGSSMSVGKMSFGAAASRLVQKDENREDAVIRRFNAVVTAMEFTELAHHARGLVQLLKAEDVPMDYPRFAQDLFYFQIPGGADHVRLRWGEDFYRFDSKSEENNEGGN